LLHALPPQEFEPVISEGRDAIERGFERQVKPLKNLARR
jgi:hypothetical protein